MHVKKKVVFLSFGCFFLIGMMLKNPSFFSSAVQRGISLCAKNVIPTLFPFLILSRCLIGCGFSQLLPEKFKNLFSDFFGIPPGSASTVLVGMFCGFPVGCRMAIDDYRSEQIEKEDFTKLMSLVTLPSPAFVIGTVGAFFQNAKIGVVFVISLLCSTFLVGLFQKGKKKTQSPKERCSFSTVPSFIKLFCDAVASSTQAMLTVCAYVIFFSAFVAAIGNACRILGIPDFACTFLQGMTEMTSGIHAASQTLQKNAGILMTAFFLGFSGLSVHSQLLAFCPENTLSYRRFILSKIGIGILCVFIVSIALRFVL